MTNLSKLQIELNNNNYFGENTQSIYESILEENNLDPYEEYTKANDRVNMLESVYDVLSALANDINSFRKVETEFTTTSAAYEYIQRRLKDIRAEIDRVKLETRYTDESGNESSILRYMYFNTQTNFDI